MKNRLFGIIMTGLVLAGGFAPAQVVAAPERTTAVAAETINLNQADEVQLQEIPGIGPALAARIIAYRAEHGPFSSIAQLTEVKGVGRKKLEKMRAYLVL